MRKYSKYVSVQRKMYTNSEVANIVAMYANKIDRLPKRNCDVGTAEEQGKRFWAYCKQFLKSQGMCVNCPLYKGTAGLDECLCKWAQMPYESEVK